MSSQVLYASMSVGKTRSRSPARSHRELMDQATTLLNGFSLEEIREAKESGAAISVRFVGPERTPTVFRGEHPEGSRWAGFSPAEVLRAKAKVRAVAIAASKPRQDALARIAAAKRLANEAFEAS